MKNLLYRLFENSYLDRNEARDVLLNMARGQYNDSQIAAFITVFLMRSITLDELVGFREALLEMQSTSSVRAETTKTPSTFRPQPAW